MRVGAQTYTIREFTQTQTDFAQSMEKLAGIGYQTVQLSAIGSFQAEWIRDICDQHGLQIVLTHTDPDRILNQTEAVIAEHDILGCDYIGIGIMPERYRSADGVKQFVRDFHQPAQAIRGASKLLMYHNHAMEWERVSPGETMLDVLLQGLPSDLMGITLDGYWVQAAGADVCDTIRKLSDRVHCFHAKDMTVKGFEQRMAVVGEGNLPFQKILKLLHELGVCKYLLVEQDTCYGEDPFDCLKRSYEYLIGEGYA
jgi:sugar phosphate isomerase/epimerase